VYHLATLPLLLSAWASAAPLARAPGEKTWAFVVSVLEYRDAASYEPFPKADRRDARLVRRLVERGGVPREHVVWLKDERATLERAKEKLARLLDRTRPGDLLYFYFAGHGERSGRTTFLVPYDAREADLEGTAWKAAQVFELLEERFKGERVIVAADACYTGGLCEQAKLPGRRLSYACFASVEAAGGSTGSWTFSDAFLDGLDGDGALDADGDGSVTLGELGESVEREMAAREGQLADWAATGKLSADAALAPVRERRRPRPLPPTAARAYADGAPVLAEWDGDWYEAKVTGFKLGLHRVAYDGWSSDWDEWVPAGRLKPR
jgi:hypothetical protein